MKKEIRHIPKMQLEKTWLRRNKYVYTERVSEISTELQDI